MERDQTNAAIKQQLSLGGGGGGGGVLQGGDQQPLGHQLQPKVVQVNQPVSRPLFLFYFVQIFPCSVQIQNPLF